MAKLALPVQPTPKYNILWEDGRPLLLDLFCGAGGAAMGYYLAGFNVIGCDINPQPHYPFLFVQMDAFEFIERYWYMAKVVHASPPCQRYSSSTNQWRKMGYAYPDLISKTRDAVLCYNKPYVIENIVGAQEELYNPIMLCGTRFGLYTTRHRLFESNLLIHPPAPICKHVLPQVKMGRKPKRFEEYIQLVGNFIDVEYGRMASGIHWMIGKELSESIPPAYTQYIGAQILPQVW